MVNAFTFLIFLPVYIFCLYFLYSIFYMFSVCIYYRTELQKLSALYWWSRLTDGYRKTEYVKDWFFLSSVSFQKNQCTKAPTLPLTGSTLDQGTGGMVSTVQMDLKGNDLQCWQTRWRRSHKLTNGVARTCESCEFSKWNWEKRFAILATRW